MGRKRKGQSRVQKDQLRRVSGERSRCFEVNDLSICLNEEKTQVNDPSSSHAAYQDDHSNVPLINWDTLQIFF